MKIFTIIILLLLTSCGYQPVYLNSEFKNFQFSKISTEGDININRQIINTISFKEEINSLYPELLIKSLFNTIETSKNSKGQTESYRSNIFISLEIKDKDKIIKEKTFSKVFSYSNKENKFELIQYQNEIKNNLTNQAIQEIILYLNIE